MKHFGRKLLSLGLVTIMLVTMLPMGIFTASALDYTQSEFTIASASDWNDLASATQNFAGKTVKLTRDFNANGATLESLFDTFSGTFDGQGYTISNFTATDALIAKQTTAGAVIKNLNVQGTVSGSADTGVGMLVGSHDGTGSLTISDVTVNGTVNSTGTHAGGVIGVLTLKEKNVATLANVTANVTVNNTKSVATNQMSGTGGVIGIYEPIGKPTLTVSGINLTGSVSSKASVGGVIGAVFTTKAVGSTTPYDNDDSWGNGISDPNNSYAGNDKTYYLGITADELYTGGTITVANVQSTLALSTNVVTEMVGAGGVVGTFGGFKRYHGDNFAFDGTLDINNCAIGGSIKNTSGASHPVGVGGILGAMSYSHAKVSVKHCVITASFPQNSLTGTKGEGAGLILGASGCQAMSSLDVNNCVTTSESFALIGSILAKAGGGNKITGAWLVLNNKNLTETAMPYNFLDEDAKYHMATNGASGYPWTYSASVTDTSVLTVSTDVAAAMVKTNAKGYVYRVGGQITSLAVQDNAPDGATLTSGDTYAIRFIGLTHVEKVTSAKITVIVRNTETGKAFKRYNSYCKIYDALNAYDVNGAKLSYYKATDFGAKKFLALTIGNIPAGTAYTFEFTPSYTTSNGVLVTGETVSISYDQNGQYVKAKEAFDVSPLILVPSIRVMSSNIMTEDPRWYNCDNKRNDTGEAYNSHWDFGNDPKYYPVFCPDPDTCTDDTCNKNECAVANCTDPDCKFTTDLKNYLGSGKCYQMYMRDDRNGENLGRINKVAGTGLSPEQRIAEMAKIYMAYEPDFIGLQEVNGSASVHNSVLTSTEYSFPGEPTKTMQNVLKSYMGSNYDYVAFDVPSDQRHYTPIMYRTDKWTVTDTYIALDTGCEMHRWQWARFESIENSKYSVIVLNLHGHTSSCGKYAEFYEAVNAEIKRLEELYPESTIVTTGDYNLQADSEHLATMVAGTQVKNSMNLTTNDDSYAGAIDHVFASRNHAIVEQFRVVSNAAGLSRATDHPSVFADIRLEPTPNTGAMMDWNVG